MCVWDMFFFTGEVYILRAAIGLLTFAQEILLRKRQDKIMSFLLKFDCKSADTSELINTIHKVIQMYFCSVFLRSYKRNFALFSCGKGFYYVICLVPHIYTGKIFAIRIRPTLSRIKIMNMGRKKSGNNEPYIVHAKRISSISELSMHIRYIVCCCI